MLSRRRSEAIRERLVSIGAGISVCPTEPKFSGRRTCLAVYQHRDPATRTLRFGDIVRNAGMGTGPARRGGARF